MTNPPDDTSRIGATRSQRSEVLLFADFELRADAGELFRAGVPVKLQPQPAKVLEVLARHAGELVTREEIRCQVWGEETFVDFEQSLNFSIKQIRRALGDSASSPSFIETVPRRGYRFLPEVRLPDRAPPAPAPAAEPATAATALPAAPSPPRRRSQALLRLAAMLVLALSVMGHRPPPDPAKLRLAVLPFESLDAPGPAHAAAPAGEALGDAVTEELITELARRYSERLGVIARTSAMAFRRSGTTPREIGREIEVEYLVQGSVRRSGDMVRVAVQLIRTEDETHVWAERYERPLGPPLYREIADQVARALRLAPDDAAEELEIAEVAPAAHEAYLDGLYLTHHGRLGEAVAASERAIELAPDFARAHAALAGAILSGPTVPAEMVPVATAAARRALALDPGLAEAHLAMAELHLYVRFDKGAAGRELERTLQLSPGLAAAHDTRAAYLSSLGRHEEAIAAQQRARELDPRSPLINANLAWRYYLARRYGEAIAQAKTTMELPHQSWVRRLLVLSLTSNGERAKARQEMKAWADFDGWARLAPEPPEPTTLEDLWAWRLRFLEALAGEEAVPPQELMTAALALGDRDRALVLLAAACRERYGRGLVFLAVDPLFDPVRTDPRFPRLDDCTGLPDEALAGVPFG